MNLVRTADASQEPIDLSEIDDHLRGIIDDDETTLLLYARSARHQVETYLGKTLITSVWELKLDSFEDCIELPMSPIASIDEITYIDSNGDNQTLGSSAYQFSRDGRLRPSYGNEWPDTRAQMDAVTITYTAGSDEVQDDIKHAMLLMIGKADIAREDIVIGTIVTEIPGAAKNLLAPYRRIRL